MVTTDDLFHDLILVLDHVERDDDCDYAIRSHNSPLPAILRRVREHVDVKALQRLLDYVFFVKRLPSRVRRRKTPQEREAYVAEMQAVYVAAERLDLTLDIIAKHRAELRKRMAA